LKEAFPNVSYELLVQGLSHEPFVEDTARWLIEGAETLKESRPEPDLGNFCHYLDVTYGVSDDQALRALDIAEERIKKEINGET
jgi:hypothetical protein